MLNIYEDIYFVTEVGMKVIVCMRSLGLDF